MIRRLIKKARIELALRRHGRAEIAPGMTAYRYSNADISRALKEANERERRHFRPGGIIWSDGLDSDGAS